MKGLELFDSVGEDLRPQIRELRDDRARENLEHDGVYKMTLQEYAEHQVLKRHVGDKISYEGKVWGYVEATFRCYDMDEVLGFVYCPFCGTKLKEAPHPRM